MHVDPIENKGVIFEIFAGFDVVLILICPVEFDLLTLVGNGNKIAVLVVSVKEGIQCRIHVCLQCSQIGAFRKLLLELQILLFFLCGVGESVHGHSHFCHAFLNLLHFGTDFFFTALRERGKSLLHHFRQTLGQKLFNLRFAEIHHAINTEIEVRFIELEDFL